MTSQANRPATDYLDFFNAADPAAAFFAAFNAGTKKTTLAEWRTLDRVCKMLVEQRVRLMIENYAATQITAMQELQDTDIGASLIDAGMCIDHCIDDLESLADHASFVAECKACGF